MDWNSKTASEWDWENLAGFNGKTIDIPKLDQQSNHKTKGDGGMDDTSIYSSGGVGFSSSDLGCGSSSKSSISALADSLTKEGMQTCKTVEGIQKKIGENKDFTKLDGTGTLPSLCALPSSGEPIIGLKLGKRMYFEDICAGNSAKSSSFFISSSSAATTKRSRACYQRTQISCCQVEGCNLDLKSAKDYHRRHRICENHSKSPTVIVAGMERRFCQQCSRFHELSEFDDEKRSCRRRLSDHNARRRRPQADGIQFNSASISSAFYDGRQQMNAVLNRVPFPASNPTWQNSCGFKVTQAEDSLIRPAKPGGIDRQLNLPTNEMPDATSMLEIDSNKMLSFESSVPRVFNQDVEASAFASNLDVAPDLRRALSLLSTTSWGLNEPEPSSLDQLMHVNQTNMAQPVMHAELPNWQVASSEHERLEQSPPESRVHSFNLPNNGSSIHFQEFQLLKAPYGSGCFYSNQIN